MLCGLLSPLYAEQVYKCQTQQGKTSYQDTPCLTGTQSVVKELKTFGAQAAKPLPAVSNATSTPPPAQLRCRAHRRRRPSPKSTLI
ncbi:DUF4124 domain-containing protein [Chitinibacter fontanus]